jgi:CheY-like chemotaxis protein
MNLDTIIEKDFLPPNNSQKLKILIVEDNPVTQRVNCMLLDLLHCDFDLAINGEEALSKFNQSQYDLVLLDIELPDINGLEICRLMRQRETEKRTPIIFITTYSEDLYYQTIKAGADQCLPKPISLKNLSKIINQTVI